MGCCSTHLANDQETIKNRPVEIAKFKEIIKNAENMIALLEKEAKRNKKPKPCLGHGPNCECTILANRKSKREKVVVNGK